MTNRYLIPVLRKANRLVDHHDQVAQSTAHPEHEYLRYVVLRVLEGETDHQPVDRSPFNGVTVGYGSDDAMFEKLELQ